MCVECKIDNKISKYNNFIKYNIYFQNINDYICIMKLKDHSQFIYNSYFIEIQSLNMKFNLNWNIIENTYFLNDLNNKKYEINYVTGYDESNNIIKMNGCDIINLFFINPPQFKNIKLDCLN